MSVDRVTALSDLVGQIDADNVGRLRLAPERELATRLGISRNSVREQLSALEFLGIVSRTQGRGTYVDVPRADFLRLYFDLALRLGQLTIPHLEETREMIEREVVRQAALRATPEEIRALEHWAAVMLGASNAEAGDEADFQFHMTLLRMAHNPVISLLGEALSSALRQLFHERRRMVRRQPETLERTNGTHPPIVAAVRRRDPDEAVVAMDDHFRVWREESLKLEERE